MKTIEYHKTNYANENVDIEIADNPGSGGAHHRYIVSGFDTETNPSATMPYSSVEILFQNGPIAEVGVNGLTHEVLIAILINRLECFQAGPYACEENRLALDHLHSALEALHSRTIKRIIRGVEGTHTI